jgi:hypothetical protein
MSRTSGAPPPTAQPGVEGSSGSPAGGEGVCGSGSDGGVEGSGGSVASGREGTVTDGSGGTGSVCVTVADVSVVTAS